MGICSPNGVEFSVQWCTLEILARKGISVRFTSLIFSHTFSRLFFLFICKFTFLCSKTD
nr:MAG TPA: hypothetical protein [Caudoviricetes sp.]DAO25932.1 MAG TPA: hypothetical protein [Caudoviricetes sp.]DAR53508.1 MAG TPA: hypothetical protein [Caudoviricetes sp.]DAW89596.1 MAG TPA: hypothetical protein [Bacteriophage sp.]